MSLITLAVNKADSSAASDAEWSVDGEQGTVDANGAQWLDLVGGDYLLTIRTGGVSTTLPVYVPDLEGPYTVSQLKNRRPGAGVVIYGTALHGMDALTQGPNEQTLTTVSPGTWTWPAGFAIGWTAWDAIHRRLWIAGQGQKQNAALTTGTQFILSYFEPGQSLVEHQAIPTTTGTLSWLGTTGGAPIVTGGIYGADVAVMQIDGKTWVIELATYPFNGVHPWHIGQVGVGPLLAVAKSPNFGVDSDASVTTEELHNANAAGADAFPLATSSFGDSYYDALLASELAVTPASNVLIVPQYAAVNPNHPTQNGGSILAIDPATQKVLAQWVSPLASAPSTSSETEYAGTVADDSSVGGGTITWGNVTFAQGAPDGITSNGGNIPAGGSTHMLKCTNYGFAVPSNATIIGIVATCTRNCTDAPPNVIDGHVWIVKGGVIQNGATDQSLGATWKTAFADYSLPVSTSNLWGLSWTPSDINSSGFGVAWQATNSSGTVVDTAEIDAVALTVYYTTPGNGKSDPRAPMVDPTGTLGAETFAVIYDTFDSQGGAAAFNSFQMFTYDHVGGTITPISDWLLTDSTSDHWTNGNFDENGWLWLSRRIRSTTTRAAVFPKTDGAWKCSQFPFAYTGTYGVVCTPDFTVDTAGRNANYTQVRGAADDVTDSMWFLTANLRAQGIRHEGDAHAPRLTALPPVDSGLNTYVAPNEAGLLSAMKPSIDPVGRALYCPVAQIYKNSETWPLPPGVRNQYMAVVDLDRCGAGPQWARSSTRDQLSQTTATLDLPTNWQAGDFVGFFFANTLTTDPATTPITVSGGWTKVTGSEVRNGAAGLRYLTIYRIMDGTETSGPTLSWTGTKNLIWIGFAEVGVDPTTPVDVFSISTGPAAGSTNTFTAPSVTPSLTGCRILHAYITQGSDVFTTSLHETTPGEISRRLKSGTTLSALVTEEEQLATTLATRTRFATFPSNGLNAAMTIALRPAAAVADPPAVSTVACVPNPVAHGNTTVCTVTLASAATRDTVATVTASNGRATVPYTCFIASGSTSGTVTINAVSAGTCTIAAKTVGSTQSTVLTVT